ncbi:2,3-butanediol dehydrogenase [Saccharopolyspora indica]|uniref:2,3-butanediol dehydrogenase n=1 Tax=Saccharopolyspora indica TaxID=1229659 RepID=UPI0022EA1D78|nr:2,3-butanediol dehydrogenase [Saccharopolyspora indica]MDA3645248.1 2,3-butanediol dehydrogenase [Saccharopolyspora indica]
MKAAVYHGAGDVRIGEVPVRAPGPGEVQVRVAYCGICGSDKHEFVDGPHAIPVDRPHPESGVVAPLVLGHEFCGTVTAVGADVRGLAEGDRLAIEPHYRCGRCDRCRSGEYNICAHFGFAGLMGHGGLAEYATVPAYMAHVLPEDVSFEQAAVFEPASVALHALRRSGARPGESMAVVGLGPIGLLITLLARQLGVGRIHGVDPESARRELAAELGASSVGDDVPEVDVAFEAVGIQSTLDTSLAVTRAGGRVVLAGLGGRLDFDAFRLVNREQSIIATVGYRDTFPELIRLASQGVDFSRIVTSTVPLDEVVERGLRAGAGEVKVVVRP